MTELGHIASAENEGFVRRDELYESPFGLKRRKNKIGQGLDVTRPFEQGRVLRQAKWATIVTDNEAQS